jgi:polyisoprenoid-binding protein YceI
MKKIILVLLIAMVSVAGMSQKRTTTSAIVAFDATTALDNLPKAENKTVVAGIDPTKGTVQFEATIKNFDFANPKIQEHFNQKGWMNSDEFPTATFDGAITNPTAVNFKKDGVYTVTVEGDLTIRGKTQKVSAPATITVAGKSLNAKSDFSIKLADYGIDGPSVSSGKVSREPKITVSVELN